MSIWSRVLPCEFLSRLAHLRLQKYAVPFNDHVMCDTKSCFDWWSRSSFIQRVFTSIWPVRIPFALAIVLLVMSPTCVIENEISIRVPGVRLKLNNFITSDEDALVVYLASETCHSIFYLTDAKSLQVKLRHDRFGHLCSAVSIVVRTPWMHVQFITSIFIFIGMIHKNGFFDSLSETKVRFVGWHLLVSTSFVNISLSKLYIDTFIFIFMYLSIPSASGLCRKRGAM